MWFFFLCVPQSSPCQCSLTLTFCSWTPWFTNEGPLKSKFSRCVRKMLAVPVNAVKRLPFVNQVNLASEWQIMENEARAGLACQARDKRLTEKSHRITLQTWMLLMNSEKGEREKEKEGERESEWRRDWESEEKGGWEGRVKAMEGHLQKCKKNYFCFIIIW